MPVDLPAFVSLPKLRDTVQPEIIAASLLGRP